MAFSLLLSRFHNKHKKTDRSSSRKRRTQLNLEALEDRTLPAVTVPQLYVADIYFTEFGESRPAAEIANIASELLPGFTATDVANQILSTPIFQVAEIRQLYAKFAGIDPGSDAISFWLDFLTQPGNTMDTVRIDFFSSDIYYNRVGGTNTAFVSALFGDVWSQPVDAGLLNQFVNQLNNGASRAAVTTAFVTDPRGYRAQVVADYEKVLDRQPLNPQDSVSLSFFTGFRQNGGPNEQVLAQLHGSSELLKHMQFFLTPPPPKTQVPFSDPNTAAGTFRAQLPSQIAAVQAAEMNAVKAAKQAQQDAKNAAADEMDAAQQVQNALTNSMGPPEQTPNDSNDQEDALDAARDAQQDATDAAVQHADAVQQVQNAQAAFDSAEPTSVTMKALSDAKAAEAAAKMSADKAQADADKANMAANAAQSCGTSTDLPSYLMCLDMMAGDAATDAVQAKAQADILAEAAADDALPEPSPQNDSDNANDVDTVLPQMNAQDIAKAAMSAVQSPPVPHYSAGSQAALFIDQAMVEARAAKSAADFCAAFANDADMDRNAVGDQVMAAHNAAMATHTAVENALVELTQIETFDFFSDPLGFVDLFNRFFMDYNTAVTQEAMAIKADTGPNGAQAKLSRVSSDKTNADTQRSNAETHKNNTNTDIMLAAQAALTAANMNPNHEGDNHSGDRPGGNHVG